MAAPLVRCDTPAWTLMGVSMAGFNFLFSTPAALAILGLLAKRMEPNRTRLSMGETIAIMVVIVSILLLGWEMLYWFDILPIKLHRHGG